MILQIKINKNTIQNNNLIQFNITPSIYQLQLHSDQFNYLKQNQLGMINSKPQITSTFINTQVLPQHHLKLSDQLNKTQNQQARFERVMNNNKKWSKQQIQKDSEYFKRLVDIQKPQFLWIGCADSRVSANEILGLKSGQIFVHRNVANIVPPNDINALAVIQYAVETLKVKDIMVTGHYGCGGIRAAFNQNDHGPLEGWLSYVRQLRSANKLQLLGPQEQQQNDLVQLNVKRQVLNVARIPSVQKAWCQGRQLKIHGLVYKLQDGLLKDLGITLRSLSDVPPQYRVFSIIKKEQKPKL